MEATVAATLSQQRARFHKLERTRPWWRHTNHDVRVPGVYLTSAFLAFLYFLSERRMNNLRVCNGLDGSIPCAYREFCPYQPAYLWHVNRRSR